MNVERLVKDEIRRVAGEKERPKHELTKVEGYLKNTYSSPIRKFASVFFEEDLPTVKRSLIKHVIIPGIKDLFYDIFVSGVERTLYGDSTRSVSTRIKNAGGSLVRNYSAVSDTRRRVADAQEDVSSKFSYKDIIMRDRASAQALLDIMQEAIKTYNNVSIAELYDAIGDEEAKESMEYTDNYWGWTNLDSARIQRVAKGYWLILPKPVSLR